MLAVTITLSTAVTVAACSRNHFSSLSLYPSLVDTDCALVYLSVELLGIDRSIQILDLPNFRYKVLSRITTLHCFGASNNSPLLESFFNSGGSILLRLQSACLSYDWRGSALALFDVAFLYMQGWFSDVLLAFEQSCYEVVAIGCWYP